MKILVADDEEELGRAIGTILKYSGYEVKVVNDGEEVLNEVEKNNYDALILDVMMPKKNGIEVATELRQKYIQTPILMLTAKSEVEDKIEGLDAGANDYLTKPFNKDELLARLRAITRNEQNKKIKIGNVTLNKEDNELSTEKASFHLNSKECQVMEMLISYQDKSVKKEEIKNRIWGTEFEDEVVPIYISYLQDKFQALGANIVIRDNNGYCLERLV